MYPIKNKTLFLSIPLVFLAACDSGGSSSGGMGTVEELAAAQPVITPTDNSSQQSPNLFTGSGGGVNPNSETIPATAEAALPVEPTQSSPSSLICSMIYSKLTISLSRFGIRTTVVSCSPTENLVLTCLAQLRIRK